MKNILIASTALALTAGFAAADAPVLSGSARMGVTYDDSIVAPGSKMAFSSRVRFVVTAAGTTDGGLSFGASTRLDQFSGNNAALGSGGTTNGDSTVFLSGAFGKITMGDVSGAADALVGQTDGVGYGPNDGLHEIGFIGTTKTAMYYEMSTAGGLTFGVGAGQVGSDELNAAVKYTTDTFSVALGYEDDSTAVVGRNRVSVLGSMTLGAATIKAKYMTDSVINDDSYSVSASGTFGGVGVTAFYTHFGASDSDNIGLGGSYDLGGGAAIKGAVISVGSPIAGADSMVADLGVTFSF